jgi:hypothetical protein
MFIAKICNAQNNVKGQDISTDVDWEFLSHIRRVLRLQSSNLHTAMLSKNT